MNEAKAFWDVKEKIGKDLRIVAQLTCNGRVVHEVKGPTGRAALLEYAKRMNERGEPEPPPKTRVGADGYSFKTPPKKSNETHQVMPSMREWAKKHGIK